MSAQNVGHPIAEPAVVVVLFERYHLKQPRLLAKLSSVCAGVTITIATCATATIGKFRENGRRRDQGQPKSKKNEQSKAYKGVHD